jgi:hypothetical protein
MQQKYIECKICGKCLPPGGPRLCPACETWERESLAERNEKKATLPIINVNKAREEMLIEIDEVLQGSAHWVGGRLDTIKKLCAVSDSRKQQEERIAELEKALEECVYLLEGTHGLSRATTENARDLLAKKQEVE